MSRTLATLASLMLLAGTLFGGDCLQGGSCCNECPLAQQANDRLATGREALAIPGTVRDGFVKDVLGRLGAV